MVGDVSEIYVTNFSKMLNDPNFNAQELTAIANGYSALLTESTELLKELKEIITANGLSLNDKERMDATPDPSGSKGDTGSKELDDASKLASSLIGDLKTTEQANILANYM
jgi:hypothetical protein